MTKHDLRGIVRDENAASRRRHEHHQERRRKAALAGLHLPDVLELATGFPYLHGQLAADAQAYVERLLPRLRKGPKSLLTALEAATVTPGLEQLQALAWQTRVAVSGGRYPKLGLGQHVLRFDTYAAAAGCPDAPARVALGLASMVRQRGLPVQDKATLLNAMAGWLLLAAEIPDQESQGRLPARERARELGQLAVRRLVDVYGPPEDKAEATLDSIPNGCRPQRRTIPIEAADASPRPVLAADDTGIVVLREIGAPDTEDGKRICETWAELLGARLPVTPVPSDIDSILAELLRKFPHAGPVVTALGSDLAGRRDLVFRPTILVGLPGVGKTAFLTAMLTALGIHNEIVPCAASYHHGITGSDRHWNSAAPSLPMRLIAQHRSATVAVVLDEIEKAAAGSGRGGRGGTFDALLPLLEPSTASAYVEKFFQAKCDLSHVIWFATANDLAGIPLPLRDRCRVITFPEPRPEHIPVLAKALLRDAVAARGLDPAWALPLDGTELHALTAAWPGGSLRRLGRLVDAVLAARDHCPVARRH